MKKNTYNTSVMTIKNMNKNLRSVMHSTDSSSSMDSIYSDDEDDMIIFTNHSIYSYPTDPRFEKYIGKQKFFVYVLLRIFNPFKNIVLIESTLTNILNVFFSKIKREKEIHQKENTIYIFYNENSNIVTKIKYIGINSNINSDVNSDVNNAGNNDYNCNQSLLKTSPNSEHEHYRDSNAESLS